MKLPNAGRAIVDIVKLRDYCLNPQHPYGRHKARVFRAALNFDQSRAEELRQVLLQIAETHDAELGEKDDYGPTIRDRLCVDGSRRSGGRAELLDHPQG